MDPNLYFALPECFDPLTTTLDFDQWVRKFQACAEANQWAEADQLRHLPPLLRGDAWILFDELVANEKDTMAHLVDNMSKKLNVATQIQSSEMLNQRDFDPGSESLVTYQNDIKRLVHRAYPELQPEQVKPITLTAFIRGLKGHSVGLARKVRNANPKSLRAALEKAQFLLSDPFGEDQHQDHVPKSLAISGLEGLPEQHLEDRPVQENDDPEPAWVERIVSALQGSSRSKKLCHYCGRPGHLQKDCYKKKREEFMGKRARPSSSQLPMSSDTADAEKKLKYPRTMGAICDYCLKRNHTEAQCQTKKKALERKAEFESSN